MRRILLVIFMLGVSSSVFGQQTRRVNYYYYEMDADDKSLVQITSNAQLNVYLFDKDNFQKYQQNQQFHYDSGTSFAVTQQGAVLPMYLVPPKKQHWYLVLDNRNGLPFPQGMRLGVVLFSKSESLTAKPPPQQ